MTAGDARAVLLIARQPTEWPAVPDPLSFSALLVLRQCPRRWAYSRARFEPGGLFDDGGRLQERANWAAVRGRIVHKTLQTLLEIHRRQGGPPAGSWALVRFWKQHLPPGGVPALVAGAADEELESLARASRNRPIMQWLRQRAAREAGALVASVNAKLGVALLGASVVLGAGMLQSAQRRALRLGAHPEVTVEATLQGAARARRWRGVIDVARVGKTEISLVDYKGGSEQPSHREQLELYALLFARDLSAAQVDGAAFDTPNEADIHARQAGKSVLCEPLPESPPTDVGTDVAEKGLELAAAHPGLVAHPRQWLAHCLELDVVSQGPPSSTEFTTLSAFAPAA